MKNATSFARSTSLGTFIRNIAIITLTAALIASSCAFPVVYAAEAEVSATEAEISAAEAEISAAAEKTETAAPPQTRARNTRVSGVSLADAAVTAEKMYYCGELYLFADSMIKINYEMASIAENLKDSMQKGSLTRNRTALNAMTVKYNTISEKYNSWVDVKADLEYFIDTIGSRSIYSKSQLQIAYKRTLDVINAAKDMLGAAKAYYDDQSGAARRALTVSADALTVSAANAVNAIAPYAEIAIAAYRSLFDQFASQSGLEIDYKTWRNPETEA